MLWICESLQYSKDLFPGLYSAYGVQITHFVDSIREVTFELPDLWICFEKFFLKICEDPSTNITTLITFLSFYIKLFLYFSGRTSKCPRSDSGPRALGEVLRPGPCLGVGPPLQEGVDHGRGQQGQDPQEVGPKVARAISQNLNCDLKKKIIMLLIIATANYFFIWGSKDNVCDGCAFPQNLSCDLKK